MRIARQIGIESHTVDYAGFWLRLAALAIDGLVLGVFVWLFNGLWSMVFGLGWMGSGGEGLAYGEVGAVYWIAGLMVPFSVITAYFICLWAWRGQTLGMTVVKIQVTRFGGTSIGWGDAVMRYLGYILAVMPALLGFVWVAFDSRRQGVHDKIAGTFVVRLQKR